MKKNIAKFSMLTLCAAAILVVPVLSRAQDNANAPAAANPPAAPTAPPAAPPPAVTTPPAAAPAAPETPPVKKKHVASSSANLSFHGTLTAVDTNAMTLTVEKRTFNMTSGTTVTKNDKPAVLADGVVGEPVRGAYKKSAKGELDAVTVHFGGNAEGKKKESAGN